MGKFKQKREQKKLERLKKREEEFQQTKKEIEELLKNISEMTGHDEAIKMIDMKMPTKKERFFSALLKYGLSLILILAITGFIQWVYYDSFLIMLGLGLSIVLLEYLMNFIIMFFFGKYILYSFGTINILPPILSIIICSIFFPFIEVVSVWLLVAVILIYMIVRKIMLSLLKDDSNKKRIIKRVK